MQKFPPHILSLGYYTSSNASDWIDLKDFMKFAASQLSQPSNKTQQPGSLRTTTNQPTVKPEPEEHHSISHLTPPPTQPLVTQSQTKSHRSSFVNRNKTLSTEDVIEISDSDDANPSKPTSSKLKAKKPVKRKRDRSPDSSTGRYVL